jgi:hypothetical protein
MFNKWWWTWGGKENCMLVGRLVRSRFLSTVHKIQPSLIHSIAVIQTAKPDKF